MSVETETEVTPSPTRIAVYDDLLSAPRIVDVEPGPPDIYMENIAAKTYELSQHAGGSVPYTVIREVCENFIHADFKDPCISILDKGNTIRFSDQGPGIEDKERAQLPGFTTASSDMRKYIRGVGSGLPTVREYLKFSHGRLIIEDNLRAGTVVTITIADDATSPHPVVYSDYPQMSGATQNPNPLEERDYAILTLAAQVGTIGPTDVNRALGISTATSHRVLKKLEERGLLDVDDRKKRFITDKGKDALSKRG